MGARCFWIAALRPSLAARLIVTIPAFAENEQDILWGYGAETAQMRRCCAFRFPTRGEEIFAATSLAEGEKPGSNILWRDA